MRQCDVRKAEMVIEDTCKFDMNKFIDIKHEVGKIFYIYRSTASKSAMQISVDLKWHPANLDYRF